MKGKNQNGFIPLIICLLLVLGLVVWFSFKHVSNARKVKDAANQLKTLQQDANGLNQ